MKDILDKAIKGGFPEKDAENILLIMATGNDELKELVFNFVVLSHDFLKGFFGEEEVYNSDHTGTLQRWQTHAFELVLSTDRKSYLKRFI